MASERLVIPEEHLADVIKVIRRGLEVTVVHTEVQKQLEAWCDDEEAYLKRMAGEDEE